MDSIKIIYKHISFEYQTIIDIKNKQNLLLIINIIIIIIYNIKPLLTIIIIKIPH